MTERMVRISILLNSGQRLRLEEIAKREGKSMSAVTRQVIEAGLERIKNEAKVWKKRSRLLSKLRRHRKKQPFIYKGDLVNEARQEREDEVWNAPAKN